MPYLWLSCAPKVVSSSARLLCARQRYLKCLVLQHEQPAGFGLGRAMAACVLVACVDLACCVEVDAAGVEQHANA